LAKTPLCAALPVERPEGSAEPLDPDGAKNGIGTGIIGRPIPDETLEAVDTEFGIVATPGLVDRLDTAEAPAVVDGPGIMACAAGVWAFAAALFVRPTTKTKAALTIRSCNPFMGNRLLCSPRNQRPSREGEQASRRRGTSPRSVRVSRGGSGLQDRS
jgi:hypothetical protein